jgi:hypothetical protein
MKGKGERRRGYQGMNLFVLTLLPAGKLTRHRKHGP